MDAVEQLVARRLDELVSDHRPVPAVLERVQDDVRRRRGRRRALTATIAITTCLSVVAGVVVEDALEDHRADLPASAMAQVPLDGELATLLRTSTAGVLPREGGWYDFRARELEADGTLLGGEQHYDRQWFDTWGDGRVVDLRTGATESFREDVDFDVDAEEWMAAADADALLTLEHLEPMHELDLVCTPRLGGERTVLSDGSVVESSVRTDAGHVVWSMYPQDDGRYRVWTARGCGGAPRELDVDGVVRALAWPDVYVSTADSDRLVRVDVTTGSRVDVPVDDRRALPDDASPSSATPWEHPGIGASPRHLAWSDGDDLTVLHLASGRSQVVASGLPAVPGSNGTTVRVGVGDRLVSWSSSPVDGDPSTSRGLLHDPVTGRTVTVDGEVWTRGPWVVWLAQDGYRVVRTS